MHIWWYMIWCIFQLSFSFNRNKPVEGQFKSSRCSNNSICHRYRINVSRYGTNPSRSTSKKMADKTIAYLLLHLLQTLVCTRGEDCRSLSSQSENIGPLTGVVCRFLSWLSLLTDLNCYNDYDHNITCFWNSTCGGTGCTIHADKIEKVPG